MKGVGDKILGLIYECIYEISKISWAGLILCLIIGGTLMMMGNESGGKKCCRNGIYGFIIIKIAEMIL